jgi:hypothetical protein
LDPSENFKVFPSPAVNEVNLAFSSSSPYQAKLQILDVVGNVISNTLVDVQIGPNQFKTDLGKLKPAAGIYFICLRTPEQMVTRKFIISK